MISVLSAFAVVLAGSGESASVTIDVNGMDRRAARTAFARAADAACRALEAPGVAYADADCVEAASQQAMRRFIVLQGEKRRAPREVAVRPTLIAQDGGR